MDFLDSSSSAAPSCSLDEHFKSRHTLYYKAAIKVEANDISAKSAAVHFASDVYYQKKRALYFNTKKKCKNFPIYSDVELYTPLHEAVLRMDVDLCRHLLSTGAIPDAIDKGGRTPLDRAIGCVVYSANFEGGQPKRCWEVIQILIEESPTDPDPNNSSFCHALVWALPEIAEMLWKKWGNDNKASKAPSHLSNKKDEFYYPEGWHSTWSTDCHSSVFCIAVQHGEIDLIEEMFQGSAVVTEHLNLVDPVGKTALDWCRPDFRDVLLRYGAEPAPPLEGYPTPPYTHRDGRLLVGKVFKCEKFDDDFDSQQKVPITVTILAFNNPGYRVKSSFGDEYDVEDPSICSGRYNVCFDRVYEEQFLHFENVKVQEYFMGTKDLPSLTI